MYRLVGFWEIYIGVYSKKELTQIQASQKMSFIFWVGLEWCLTVMVQEYVKGKKFFVMYVIESTVELREMLYKF